ncbi:MAG: glutamate--tRNA ligase [Sandaracinaceae bacterium]|nr:glutamate--tRNA ligase [Sandaracinaceae bacterium]
MTAPVRVRFAPSPSGYLHIGGVRTALYSWLWARKLGGTFILRIEDTDAERSTQESVDIILDSMRWLGLDWDEGPDVGGPNAPYRQSERLDTYKDHAEKLIASGHAYRCYATKEEIQAARDAHTATGTKDGFVFESPWRDRTDGDPSEPHSVRFKCPREGSTTFVDLIRGPIEVAHSTLQDFILLRNTGLPLYNFGCVVDDVTMGVTLVARGDDHIINTTPQVLIYQALGVPVPEFAHLPMVLGPDGKRFSKRHGAVSVMEYRDLGYLPDAVLNYLARLGWSHGDQEVFTREELIQHFDWAHCGSQAGKYDPKKFLFVQEEHLRRQPDAWLAELTQPYLAARGLEVAADDARVLAAMPYIKPRSSLLPDLAQNVDYFVRDVPEQDEKAAKKFLTPTAAPRLRALATLVERTEPFSQPALDAAVTAWLEAEGLAMKDVAQPARVALSGRGQSPGLFEVMEVLGREVSCARLLSAAEQAERATENTSPA